MATDKNFVIKNGLTVGTTEVIDSSGNWANTSATIEGTSITGTSLDINGNAAVSGYLNFDGGSQTGLIRFNGENAIGYSNEFLYINPSNHFTSGVYINSSLKVDGGLIGSYNEDLQLRTANTTALTLSNIDSSATFAGTISSGGITSSAGITANGPFKSGGSNNYILFDYDGDFTGGNYYAIQDTSANRLRISYAFSATDNIELDSSGNFYVNGGNATFAGTISSGAITIGSSTVATPNAAADDFVIKGSGTAVGMTIAQDSDSGTGTIFFGDTTSSSVGGFRYNHNTGDMAISAEDFVNFNADGLQISGTTIVDSSRNLTNIGTIDSGAITITTTGSGDLSHFNIDGANANYDFRSNSTSGYTTTFNMDNTGLEIGHNSSGRNLALRTNSTDRIIIGGTGGVDFQSNNLTSVGTISSGAITSSGAIGNTGDGYAIGHEYKKEYYYDVVVGDNDGSDNKWTLKTASGSTVTSTTSNVVYRVRLVTLGTGTDTGAVYLADNVDGNGWRLNAVNIHQTPSNEGSNYPFLELDGGVPKVSLNHPSNYTVRVFVEEYDTGNNGGHHGIFGTDHMLTAEYASKYLGVNRSDPSYTLDVGGSIGINGTQIVSSNRDLTNIGTISSGAINTTGNVTLGTFSTTNTGSLILTGSTANKQAILKCTNGNLHIDSEDTAGTYINYYEGTGGIFFGTGATGYGAHINSSGHLNLGSAAFSQSGYALSVGGTGVINSSRTNLNLNSFTSGGGSGIFFRDGFTYNCSITAEDHNGSSADGICISGYDGVSFSTGSNSRNQRFKIDVNGNFQVGSSTTAATTIIDQSKNFLNMETINSKGFWTTSSAVSYWGSGTGNGGSAFGTLTWDSGYASIYGTSGNELRLGSGGGQDKLSIKTDGNVSINGGALQISDQTVIDASRNLTNIGTISSGAITSSGTISGSIAASSVNSGRLGDARMPTTIGGSASTTFIGTLSGNASTASNTPVYTTGANSTHYVTFALTNGGGSSNGTGSQARLTDAGLTYNPSTNRLDVGGDIVAGGNVTAYSDERLKTNIQTLDGKKALQMRGVSFTKDGKKGSGIIAQELEKIAPELVLTADDEMGTKSVAYGNLVGYLIEAVKEQQKQIEKLKEEVSSLGSKN